MTTFLRAALGDYSHTKMIKNGDLADERVAFAFEDIKPIHDAFVPMVRHSRFDLSELAVVTSLQAIAFDKPIVLLPAVLASRFQRRCLISYAPRGTPEAADLVGQRIGVRSFSQTTGMWVRAALWDDYRLSADRFRWSTRDGAHVAEFTDPPFVESDDGSKSLPQQLRDGDIAAAILGNDLPDDPDFVPVIRGHKAADLAWYRRHGFMPINHMVAVTAEATKRAPDAVVAAYRLLERAAAENASQGSPSPTLFGADKLHEPIALIIEECDRQGLLPRPLTADEVLAPARQLLG